VVTELKSQGWLTLERTGKRKDGSTFPMVVYTSFFEHDGEELFISQAADVSAEQEAVSHLTAAERYQRILSAAREALLTRKEERELAEEYCRLVVESAGYALAWVGVAQHNPAKDIRVIAASGMEVEYLNRFQVTWDGDDEYGCGPAGRSIRENRAVLIEDTLADPSFAPWREAAARNNLGSCLALPLNVEGRVYGNLIVYHRDKAAFPQLEQGLLSELAHDLGRGLEMARLRQKESQANEELQQLNEELRSAIEEQQQANEELTTTNEELRASQLNLAASEERFRIMFDSVSDMAFVAEVLAEGELSPFVEVNAQACHRLGYTRRELCMLSPRDVVHKYDAQADRSVVEELQRTGRAVFERMLKARDGQLVPAELSSHLVRLGDRLHIITMARDITERRRAERELRESEERYRSYVENMQGIAYRVDPDLKPVFYRGAVTQITGYGAEELSSGEMLWNDLMFAEDIPAKIENTRQLLAGEIDALDTEYRIRTRTGEVKWVFSSVRRTDDEQGQPVYIEGVISDITSRKEAELALKDSETRYRTLFESAGEAIFIMRDGLFIDCNAAACRVFSADHDELVGRTPEQFSPDTQPDGSDSRKQAMEYIGRALEGEPQRFEWQHRRPDGTLLDTVVTLSAYEYGEKPLIIAFVRDITAEKRASRELAAAYTSLRMLEQVIDRSPAVAFAWETGKGWPVSYVSGNVAQFGYTPEDFTTGRVSYADIIHPDDLERMEAEVASYSDPGVRDTQASYRIITRDGTVRWVEDHTWVRRGDNGEPVQFEGVVLDITERRRAEERLRDSEALFRTIYENAPIMIAASDARGNVLLWNREMARYFGVLDDSMDATQVLTNAYPDEAERQHAIRQMEEAAGSFHEYHPVDLSGNRRTQLWANLRLPSGVTVSIGHDITSRVHAEQALRTSEERFRAVVESTTDCVLVWDREYNYLYANQAAIDQVGTTRDKVIGQNMRDGLGHEPEFMQRWMDRVDEVFANQQPLRVVDRDELNGRVVHSESVVAPMFDSDGSIFAVGVVYRDITARREEQEEIRRLALAVEQTADAVIITDTDGTIRYVNRAFVEITGFPRHEAIGNNPRMWKSGKQDSSFYELLWQRIKRGEVWQGQLINRHRDGHFVTVDTTISPLRDDDGVIRNFVALVRDISEELALQQQLRHAQKMEALGTMAGGIAHDFNNILFAMMGYIEMARMDVDEESRAHKNLTEVLKAGQRVKDMVQQILTFSRQSEEKRLLLDPTAVLREAVALLRVSLEPASAIALDIEENIPQVLANPTELHQVVMNLVTNAHQAMLPEGGTITIGLKTQEVDHLEALDAGTLESGSYVCLSVADQGSGMSESVRSRVFEPFYTTKDIGGGTGMGLAVVHGIVTKMNGGILLDSVPGEGTQINIYLPVLAEHAQAAEPEAAEQAPPEPRRRVLLVDDEPPVANLVSQMLLRLNCSVDLYLLPERALAEFARQPASYDLAILDQVMPDMVGTELAAKLREIRPELPVLLITGFSDTGTSRRAAAAGISDIIAKPVGFQQLREALSRFPLEPDSS
jgi:PAS domain S-box-containing protein